MSYYKFFFDFNHYFKGSKILKVSFYLFLKAKIAIFAQLKSYQKMSHRNYMYISAI